MKKHLIRGLILLLLISLLIPTLPACSFESEEVKELMKLDEESRAYELYEYMANSLLSANAFTVDSSTTFRGRLDGQEYNLTHNVKRISKSPYGAARMDYYEETHLTQQGEDYWETRLVSGYADGYLFRSNRVSGYTVNAKTAVPYSELDYAMLSEEILLYPMQWGCETVTCEKNKDGSFTATFAGLSQDGFGALYYDYGLDLSALGESIYLSDATVVIHSTPDLRFKSATYSLTFTQYAAEGYLGDRKFMVTTEQTYAYEIPEDFKGVDLDTFDDIGDLTVLDDYIAAFDARVYAERGSYVYSSCETITEDGEDSIWLYDVKMDIDTYKNGLIYSSEGSYGYPDEQYRTSASYRDGTMVFKEIDPKGEKSSGSYDYTEWDVRDVIAAELTLQDFSPVYVTRIEAVDEQAGKYRFHLGASLQAEYANYFYEKNGSLGYMKAYMDVTISDGQLMDLELYIRAEGYTATAKSHVYELKVICKFSEKNTSSTPF